jgi:SRSO17 transposase
VAYVEALTSVIGHADRALPLRDYCAGLLTAEGRKSVEPMAAVTAPARVSVQHQKLLHFVGEGKWSDESVLAKVRELVIPAIERDGPIEVDRCERSRGIRSRPGSRRRSASSDCR